MNRVQNIPDTLKSVGELARFTEASISELYAILVFMTSEVNDSVRSFVVTPVVPSAPISGELYYDDDADILYIYNEKLSAFTPH